MCGDVMGDNTISMNIRLTSENNRIIAIFKEYFGLSNKEEAINKFIETYSNKLLKDKKRNLDNTEDLKEFNKLAERSFAEIWDNDLDDRWNKY